MIGYCYCSLVHISPSWSILWHSEVKQIQHAFVDPAGLPVELLVLGCNVCLRQGKTTRPCGQVDVSWTMLDESESFKLDKRKRFAGVVFVWFLKLPRQDLRDKDPSSVLPNHWNSLIISCAPDGERANRAMQEGVGKCRANAWQVFEA